MSKPSYPNDLDTAAFGFTKILMADLATGDLRLPSLPEVVIRVRRVLTDRDSSVSDVVRVLGSDPVLAARILRCANAAYYCSSAEPVDDLPKAVNRVGFDVILNIAMSMALEQIFRVVVTDSLRQQLKDEWQHSIRVAALSQLLANRAPPLNADAAFLAGLLHGIGRLYILVRAQDDLAWSDNEEALRLIVNAWHAEIGRALILHWELSEALAQIVFDHATCDPTIADEANLTVVVAMAVRLAKQNDTGDADANTSDATCACLHLDANTSLQVVTDAREEIAHLYHTLGF